MSLSRFEHLQKASDLLGQSIEHLRRASEIWEADDDAELLERLRSLESPLCELQEGEKIEDRSWDYTECGVCYARRTI